MRWSRNTSFALIAVAASLVLGALAACTVAPRGQDLGPLYEAHDYFALRDRLARAGSDPSPETTFYRAAVRHAFNDPRGSNALLGGLLEPAAGLRADLVLDAWRLRRDNSLRLHDYGTALEAARIVLERMKADGTQDADDAGNMVRMLEALADVPPQRVAARGHSVIQLQRAATGLRVPLTINGAPRAWLFDTGANYSVVMRSEAEALGMSVRRAGIAVGNSVGGRIEADLAVAERLSIGRVDLRNVVFLVFDDALLSFPDEGVHIHGIVGFPVMEAMGEVRFRGDAMEVPDTVSERAVQNLAFEQLEPLLQVGYGDDALLCRFDTGATATEFYEPFYRRYRQRVESTGTRREARTAGVGEEREIAAWTLPEVTLRIGGASVKLVEPDVYQKALGDDPDDNYLDCNLGQDALAGFDEYVINFRSMSVLLR